MKNCAKWIACCFVFGIFLAPLSPKAESPAGAWRIGLLHVGLDHVPPSLDTLREGLRALGYEEGKDIHLDWRNVADESAAHDTAREFVRDGVDLIVAFENQSVRAAKSATTTIPVVFLAVDDPVASGIVESLAHPGGNLTGLSSFYWDLPGKKLELFKQLVPQLARVLVLIDPNDPLTQTRLEEARKAATHLKLHLVEKVATNDADIKSVFALLRPGSVDGVFPLSPNLQVRFSSLLIRLSAQKGVPVEGYRKEWVEQGALFSYAPDIRADGRAAAIYVDKILKGAKPADLPVDRRMRINLVINLKAAKTLGIEIPRQMLYQADQIIR